MSIDQRGVDWRLTATDQASPVLKIVETSLGRVQTSVMQLAGILGVGLSVSYFENLIKGSIDALVHIEALTHSTSLTVQELAGLSLVAKESGTDLDGLAKAFDRMSVAIGKDPEKFVALGVTAETNRDKFKQLADIFNSLTDVNLRNALAQAIFKKSWDDIAPILAMGGERIGELMDKGAILSRVTDENTAAAKAFNEKWIELTGTGGLLTGVTTQLLPYLNQLVDATASVSSKTDSMKTAIDAVVIPIKVMATGFLTLATAVAVAGDILFGYEAALAKLATGHPIDAFSEWNSGIDNAKTRLGSLTETISKFWADAGTAAAKTTTEQDAGLNALIALEKEGDSILATSAAAAFVNKEKETKAIADNDAAYRSLLKTLKEKYPIDGQLTELAKLQLDLDALSTKQKAELTAAQIAQLQAEAKRADARKVDLDISKSELAIEALLEAASKKNEAAIQSEAAAYTKRFQDANATIAQIELETRVLGFSAAEREKAIALYALENSGIRMSAEALAFYKEKLIAALDAKAMGQAAVDAINKVNEADKKFVSDLEHDAKQGFDKMFQTLGGGWSALMQSMAMSAKRLLADALYSYFAKPFVLQVIASVAGAVGATGVAQAATNALGAAGSGMNILSGGNTIYNIASGNSWLSGIFGGGATAGAYSLGGGATFGGVASGLGLTTTGATGGALTGGLAGYGAASGVPTGTVVAGSAAAEWGWVPYVGAALVAFAAYEAFFKGAETRQGSGSATITTGGNISNAAGQLHGGFDPTPELNLATQTVQQFSNIVTALGGTISQQFGIGIGQGGGGDYNVVPDIGGHQLANQNVPDAAGAQLAAVQAIVVGLQQAADFPAYIKHVFDAINAGTATSADLQNAMAFAGTLKQLHDNLTETRPSFQVVADAVRDMQLKLGTGVITSAADFNTKFLAAIDAGMTPATLANWQQLAALIDTMNAAIAATVSQRQALITHFQTPQQNQADAWTSIQTTFTADKVPSSVTDGASLIAYVKGLDATDPAMQKVIADLTALVPAMDLLHAHDVAIAAEKQTLQDRIDAATMTSAQLLEKQRNALDDSNKALFDQTVAAEKLAAAAVVTSGLQANQATANIALMRAYGMEEQANAAERAIAIAGMTAEQVALYDTTQQTIAYTNWLVKTAVVTAGLMTTRGALEIQLMQAQGNAAGALAAQRAIDIKDMNSAQIALYDYNQKIKDQIAATVAFVATTATRLSWEDKLKTQLELNSGMTQQQIDREKELAGTHDWLTRQLMLETFAAEDLAAAAVAAAAAAKEAAQNWQAEQLAFQSAQQAAQQKAIADAAAVTQAYWTAMSASVSTLVTLRASLSNAIQTIKEAQAGYDLAGYLAMRVAVAQSKLAADEHASIDVRMKDAADLQTAIMAQYDEQKAAVAAIATVAKYAKDLLAGPLSPMSGEAIRQQYQDTIAGARAHDLTALGNVPTATDAYLKDAQSTSRTALEYSIKFAAVQGDLASITAAALPSLLDVTGDGFAHTIAELQSLGSLTTVWQGELVAQMASQGTFLAGMGLTAEQMATELKLIADLMGAPAPSTQHFSTIDPAQSKWLAGVTGYTGDFGQGGFQAFAKLHGFDVPQLQAMYLTQALPQAATGTDFVPRDMSANIHAGERIMPAADNAVFTSLMNRLSNGPDNAALIAEIKGLRATVEKLQVSAEKTADSTEKTKDELQQVTRGGLSVQTRAAS